MRDRFMSSTMFIAIAAAAVSAVTAVPVTRTSAETPASSALALKTSWGEPDLQGIWTDENDTPLQRPAKYADQEFFTEAQRAELDRVRSAVPTRDKREARGTEADVAGAYNAVFTPIKRTGLRTSRIVDPPNGRLPAPTAEVQKLAAAERAFRVALLQSTETCKNKEPACNGGKYDPAHSPRFEELPPRRTSLIVDPPDGRLPPLTPEGKKRADERAADGLSTQLGHPHADSWEDRPLQERCLMGLNAGPPMHPGPYNNNVQLFQTPDTVVILTEMVHDARIVPLDGRPRLRIRQWKGDSRGHWEGDTLVVETTNFKRETSFPGSTGSLHLIERFTRTAPNTLLYEFTVDDATTWTRPWTAALPMAKSNQPVYEYACHEGNYAMASILAGARADEKAAAEAANKGAK